MFPVQTENYQYRSESAITWQTKLVNESDSIVSKRKTYLLFSEQMFSKNRTNNEVRIYTTEEHFNKVKWLFISWHLILIILYVFIIIKLMKLLTRLEKSIVFTPDNYKNLKQLVNILSIVGMMHFMGVGIVFLIIKYMTGVYISIDYSIQFITILIIIVFFQSFINLIMQYFIKANKIEVDQTLTV